MRTTRLVGLLATASVGSAQDLADYVLPNTGDTNGGNTFPGVTLPLGMVKLGPDLYTGSDSYSGYQATGNFTGFSMLHESGTGGAPKYGVVSQMPVVGDVENPLLDHNDTRASTDVTRVGYYKVNTGSGVTLELAASKRAGLYNYTFPSTAASTNVIVDVSHVLPSYRGQGLGQNYLGGNITVIPSPDGSSLRYEGSGSYNNGWNRAPQWTVFFCGYFDQPTEYKTFLGTSATSTNLVSYDKTPSVSSTARLGAVFTFDSPKVTSRVGVSFISSAQACSNVDDEVPSDSSLSTLEQDARGAWNDAVLSKVTTTDTSSTANLQLLYSSLYHMNIIPTNKTGENPKWTSTEPYYDDTFTLWDLFRCTTALFHIIQPDAHEEFLRSLIDIWRHDGFMPDARSSFFNGATQGGSNADNVLADAYVKGVRGSVDWDAAFEAMMTDAEIVPPNNNDPRDLSSSTKEGRGALPDWINLGYITTRYGRSVTRAIEYAGNDFGLYQVASGLGQASDAAKYLNRSRNWRNQWNPDMTYKDFSGFLGPIDTDGHFIAQDPVSCGGCYWGDAYYEALPFEYSFNAHHDLGTLVALCGGADVFVERLQTFFGDGLFNPGNEPSFTTPYLFNYVGRQDLTVYYTRWYAQTYYSATPAGLPGNSDAGAMESWILWVMLGLYPVTGQTTFLVGSPWFDDLTIHLGGGRELRITTTGGGDESYYVQSLKVNGQDWDKAWVTWDDVFAQGGTMDFVLGPDNIAWATGPAPPSPATETDPAQDAAVVSRIIRHPQ